MDYYQDNLQSKDRVYFAVEAEDSDKVIEALNNISVPVNGMYQSPIEILAHEEIEEMEIEDEDIKQDIISEAYTKMKEAIIETWVEGRCKSKYR